MEIVRGGPKLCTYTHTHTHRGLFYKKQYYKVIYCPLAFLDATITDIKMKLAAGNRCLRAFDVIFKPRYIFKKVKLRIYKTIIKPIVVYGSESWTLTTKAISLLAAWERKI